LAHDACRDDIRQRITGRRLQPGSLTVTRQPIAILDAPASRPPRHGHDPAASAGLAAFRGVQGFRRAVQATVALYIAWVVVDRAIAVAAGAMGTSPESICPFGGIETIVTFLTAGVFVPHVHSSNLEILAAFDLPADAPPSTALKDLESDPFSVTVLRDWLEARGGQTP
jgi:hypothetical protein